MDRRRFLIAGVLTPLAATALGTPAFAAGHTPAGHAPAGRGFGFAPDGSGFLLDGKPFQIRSGEMHPARIPVQYWRHRIRMAKAMGLNTVSIYVMWNYIEEQPGVFDFSTDRRDIEGFIRLCQAEGMWVLLRPGPYVCGEWDLGGIPPYLLRNPDIKLRVKAADDPDYMPAVRRYISRLAPRIEPLLSANGGPVLMVQVENEYGSYGNDPEYPAEIQQAWLDAGVPGPFYTEDGLYQVETDHSNVPGGAIALSGGDAPSIAAARQAFPDVPAMAGEVYPGWLTHWGDSGFAGPSDVSSTIKGFMDGNLSFNLYMLHGGTSFGFFAGANANDYSGDYQPDVTSYDYAAPISEQGVATPAYHGYRGLIAGYLDTALPAVPAPIATIAGQTVTPTPYTSVWDNLPKALPAALTVDPQPFEMYGQNSGFVLYRKQLAGFTGGTLDIAWVHDYATVLLNGDYAGGLSRTYIPTPVATALNVTNNNDPLPLPTPDRPTGTRLDILVEGMGRTNYGQALVDRKGILETVTLQDAGALTGDLTGWEVHLLPMDEKYISRLRGGLADPQRPGIFFKAELDLAEPGDTYLDLSDWTKGVVWVNGNNLGRYWEIGPQHRLFCPAPWLRRGRNEILVFDLHQTEARPITLAATLA